MMNSKHFYLTFLATLIVHSVYAAEVKTPAETVNNAPAVTEATSVPSPSPVATPAPAKEITAAPAKTESTSDRYGKVNRPLGDFLVGPYIEGGLPRLASFGAEGKWLDLLGLSVGYGMIPQITLSQVQMKLTGWDARFKIYPFRSSFFLGVAYGSQTFTGSMTQSISGISTTGTVVQDNTFITPHIGWNWIWDSGFFMGADIGVQLSMGQTNTFTSDATALVKTTAQYTALQKSVLDKADLLGKTPLPLLTLLKVGYFF